MQNEKQIHVGLPKHEWIEAHGIPREVPPHEPPIDWFIYWQEEEESTASFNINDEGEF
ncbi:MAG: hypothetical protein J7525_19775 [Roseofilum sp. SID3]|uniref:hypothetical protein n=1 Tax=Roseofilum sp. SID3 TaxID=2821499 RepID=UPI001B0456DD|nr:hypothetical protein [Roseofilum sp. SID3]MBP0015336.1 hypothetical protein [Roseofilum sp. SID3]